MHLTRFYYHDEMSQDVLLLLSKVTTHEVGAGIVLKHLGGQLVEQF